MITIDSAHFRQVLGHFPSGVAVVTASGPDGPVGMAVGSFFSVSLIPPLVGFCAGKTSTSWPKIVAADAFCVNILAEDQESVCRTFATTGADKFSGLGWIPGGSGAPHLANILAWIDCQLYGVHDSGDHEIAVGRVQDLAVERESGPLVFFRSGYGRFAV